MLDPAPRTVPGVPVSAVSKGLTSGIPRLSRRQAVYAVVFTIASLVLSFALERLFRQFINLEPLAIRDWLRGWGMLAPAVYVLLMVFAIVLTPIPSVPLDITAGLAFGLFWGTVWTLVGAEIGALSAFWLARRLGRRWLTRRLGPERVEKVDQLAEQMGGQAVFLMRLLPAFNFDWVSYAAGLTSMLVRTFAAATFLGMLPPVVAIVAVGDLLVSRPASWSALIFGALFVLWAVPFLWWLRPPRRSA